MSHFFKRSLMTTMKKLSCVVCVLSALVLSACSSIPTPSEKYGKYSAEQIYQVAEVKLAKKSYRDAVEAFEGLDSLYPFNPHAQQAQLDIIYAYYQNNDMPSAAAAAERYIRLYPRGEKVDYAYYLKGMANFSQDRGFFQRFLPIDQASRDPGTMKAAYDDFLSLIKLFPNSPYAPDAKQHLVFLRDMFAQRLLEISQYYYAKEAYVGAINRANEVLVQYADTPSAKDALVVLYQSYQKLGLPKSMDQVKSIMKANYPDAMKELK